MTWSPGQPVPNALCAYCSQSKHANYAELRPCLTALTADLAEHGPDFAPTSSKHPAPQQG